MGLTFRFYDKQIDPDRTLVVDGVAPCRINLSHWPGNRTPSHLKADTTTEMALRLAEDPDRERVLAGVGTVSNNHFDTDGLLSAWVVLQPREALCHRRFLVDAARAGDFGTFTAPDAVKFDLLATAFADPERSPLGPRLRGLEENEMYQVVYGDLLARLPDLFYEVDRHRRVWEEEFESIVHSFERVRNGGATIREYPESSLSVLETEEELEPMARFDSCQFHRVLTAYRDGRGYRYELEHHVFSWFDTVTPPRGKRIDLTPLASRLNEAEPTSSGQWLYTGNDDLAARLYRADTQGDATASVLPVSWVERLLAESLQGR